MYVACIVDVRVDRCVDVDMYSDDGDDDVRRAFST